VADYDAGLRLIDVSDAEAPVEVGVYDTPGNARDVAVTTGPGGTYAAVADGSGGLRLIDVSDPEAPVEVGSYDTPAIATDVAVSGQYAYVADEQAGLVILRFLTHRVFLPIVIRGH
jgi:hypothetical protein